MTDQQELKLSPCGICGGDAEFMTSESRKVLPRVQPADLVDGAFYVVRNQPNMNGGLDTLAQCAMETWDEAEEVECDPYPVLWTIGGEFHHAPEFFVAIWGPLTFALEEKV